MNIEKSEIRVLLDDLEIGAVFECDGHVYMRTYTICIDENEYINCVRLSDSRLFWFEPLETEVLHLPSAKVVI